MTTQKRPTLLTKTLGVTHMHNHNLQNTDIAFGLLDAYLLQAERVESKQSQDPEFKKIQAGIRLVLEIVRDALYSRRDHVQASALFDILTQQLVSHPTPPAALPAEYHIAVAVQRLLLPYRTV